MHAHWLQHVAFEGLGYIETWLNRAGHSQDVTRLFAGESLPTMDTVDFLIIMGGPMSVNDESLYPWLREEKAFIRRFIDSGKPVLGICLGAQLIASALGAKVFANPLKEIGWWPVHAVDQDSGEPQLFPPVMQAFHWHGETFALPPGARHLAESQGCRNQAFGIGQQVMGLQFHLETTPESARTLIENCREELVPGRYIQSEQELLAAPEHQYASLQVLMDRTLAALLEKNEENSVPRQLRP